MDTLPLEGLSAAEIDATIEELEAQFPDEGRGRKAADKVLQFVLPGLEHLDVDDEIIGLGRE